MSDSLRPRGLHSPWNSPGQNTGVGSLSLLQGIFPTQGSNPSLLHCRWILYQLSHQGSPGILEWVAYPFSSGSSRPRNRTRVFCIAGRFFTKGDSIVWIWYANRIQTTGMLYCLTIPQVLWMFCSIFAHSFFSLCLVWIISVNLFSNSGFSCWLSLLRIRLQCRRSPAVQETWVRSLHWENPPGERNDNSVQYSCLGNHMDRRALWESQKSDAT